MSYRIIMAFNLIWLFSCSLSAQSVSETRTYTKNFHVGKETSLEVSNKYGNIYITPWSKDSASIEAEIKAFGPNETKLRKMFDGISIDIDGSDYMVTARTNFIQSINNLFEAFKGMTDKLIPYDSRVEINYNISVPEYLNLKITNKYGDVFIEDCTGTFSISMSNGSLKAGRIGKGSSFSLTFCDADIRNITSGNIDASFSEITLDEALDISIKSISSRYNIKKAGRIRFESRRDKFFIDNIASMKGNSYFTDYDVKILTNDIGLTTRYGKLNADQIEAGFESVALNSGYSDISLNFDERASYLLDIRHTNTFLVLHPKNINTEERTLNAEKKEYETTGNVGNGPASARVEIEATRGNVYIK